MYTNGWKPLPLTWHNRPDAELRSMAEYAIGLIEAAQDEDGYLNSYWQVVEPERRWQDLPHGHELYCAGHLFQAAVAYPPRNRR